MSQLLHLLDNIKSPLILWSYWLINWGKILVFVLKIGPLTAIKGLREYPWLKILLQVNHLHLRLSKGRNGRYLLATAAVLSSVISGVTEFIEETLTSSGEMVLHEDMIPPEILRAMGLKPFMAELLGILLPMIDSHAVENYIDRCEAEGIPADLCSLPKSTMGLILSGHVPLVQCILSSNLPCDGGMASYALITKELQKPVFYLDIPYDFQSGRAITYFIAELREMIHWLEIQTGHKIDWKKLRRILENRNKMVALELEIWEMLRQKPAPMVGEPIWLNHLWSFNVQPGNPASLRLFRKVHRWTYKNFKQQKAAVREEKYRAILWNPPTIHFIDLFNWAERVYGVTLLIDSMSYNRLPYVDTTSNDTMLEGLARIIMQGPMARHTRGPAENYIGDILYLYETLQLDMVWVAGHIGCKSTMALNSMLREECRQKSIPLLIIEYDLSDPRIVSHERITGQVDHFMESVMEAEKLS